MIVMAERKKPGHCEVCHVFHLELSWSLVDYGTAEIPSMWLWLCPTDKYNYDVNEVNRL